MRRRYGDLVATFDDLASIAPQEIWEGVVVRPVHGEQVTLALVELAPNSRVPDHHHVNEQSGVLVRGSFRLRVGEKTLEVKPGGTWRILADVPHEVHTGPDGALAIEVWSPPRQDWGQVERLEPRSAGWP
jgi:quercetin dioxygenase-like cupin family protein